MEKPKGSSKDLKRWLVWENGGKPEIYQTPTASPFHFPLFPKEFYFDNYWDAYAYYTKLNAERRNKGASSTE